MNSRPKKNEAAGPVAVGLATTAGKGVTKETKEQVKEGLNYIVKQAGTLYTRNKQAIEKLEKLVEASAATVAIGVDKKVPSLATQLVEKLGENLRKMGEINRNLKQDSKLLKEELAKEAPKQADVSTSPRPGRK